jgi:hypothetical protein
LGRAVAEKLEVIRGVEKKERSTSEIAQMYGIPLPALSVYLKNQDSVEQQALQGTDVSKQIRICDAKCDDMENRQLEWFCNA